MAQPTSFMHQHNYVSQFPINSSLTIVKKYEYGYLLKKVSLISDLIFFLLKKRFWHTFKGVWRSLYRNSKVYKRIALSFKDKYKRLFKKNRFNDFLLRKSSRVFATITYKTRFIKFSKPAKEWRVSRRRLRKPNPIRYLHIESFRTLTYRGLFYIYFYVLRYK